jgi:murein DD-endopeptidase MepM/ murein hydrolase activator NlpD
MAPRPRDSSLASLSAHAHWLQQGWRLPLALALYVLVSVGVLGGIASFVIEQRLGERDARASDMLHELERREMVRHALEAALDELRYKVDAQDHQLHRALVEMDRLAVELEQTTAERKALEDERNLARERAQLLDRGARETERWLETAERERLSLERERVVLVERLGQMEATRGLARHQEEGLRRQLQAAERRLAEVEAEREATARWLAVWISDRLGAIETVLERTGIEPDRRLAPMADPGGTGLGGPLLPLRGATFRGALDVVPEPGHGGAAVLGHGLPLTTSTASDLDRLEAVERLLRAVPLVAPFDHFHVTSAFGRRIDPLTRRQALHHGLDFSAPAGSEVLATAPGRVTHAGRAGSYGIMVELDHGHGITTRYAHLSRTLVEAGERVVQRAPIGVIGSTGRSTGRHLHYEVHVDGEPRDPARFIAAGHQLVEVMGR